MRSNLAYDTNIRCPFGTLVDGSRVPKSLQSCKRFQDWALYGYKDERVPAFVSLREHDEQATRRRHIIYPLFSRIKGISSEVYEIDALSVFQRKFSAGASISPQLGRYCRNVQGLILMIGQE